MRNTTADADLEIKNRFELRRVKGHTQVWFDGFDGVSWCVFCGGPVEAKTFMRGFAASIESVIVAQHENGCSR